LMVNSGSFIASTGGNRAGNDEALALGDSLDGELGTALSSFRPSTAQEKKLLDAANEANQKLLAVIKSKSKGGNSKGLAKSKGASKSKGQGKCPSGSRWCTPRDTANYISAHGYNKPGKYQGWTIRKVCKHYPQVCKTGKTKAALEKNGMCMVDALDHKHWDHPGQSWLTSGRSMNAFVCEGRFYNSKTFECKGYDGEYRLNSMMPEYKFSVVMRMRKFLHMLSEFRKKFCGKGVLPDLIVKMSGYKKSKAKTACKMSGIFISHEEPSHVFLKDLSYTGDLTLYARKLKKTGSRSSSELGEADSWIMGGDKKAKMAKKASTTKAKPSVQRGRVAPRGGGKNRKGQHCIHYCRNREGLCEWCGKGMACCKKDMNRFSPLEKKVGRYGCDGISGGGGGFIAKAICVPAKKVDQKQFIAEAKKVASQGTLPGFEKVMCEARIKLKLHRCNTCCCKGGILKTSLRSELTKSTNSQCGAWFTGVDSTARVVMALNRFFEVVTYFNRACFAFN